MAEKEVLVAELRKVEKEMAEIRSNLNDSDAILVLVSFLEALDSEQMELGRLLAAKENADDGFLTAMLHNAALISLCVEYCILDLFHTSNNKRDISTIPKITTLFTRDKILSSPDAIKWLEYNVNPKRDEFIIIPYQLLGSIYAERLVMFHEYYSFAGYRQILLAMNYFRCYYLKEMYLSYLREDLTVTIPSDGSMPMIQGITPDQILQKKDIHPRSLGSFAGGNFPSWTNEVREIGEETIASTYLNAASPTQKAMLDREYRSYFLEFDKMPDFKQKFLTETKISLSDYCEITLALIRLSLNQAPPIVLLHKERLLRKVRQLTGRSLETIASVVDLFTLTPGKSGPSQCLLLFGEEYLFSWSMIAIPFRRLVDNIYHDSADGNRQGLIFEEECRKLLRQNSYHVLSARVEIEKQILPADVSIRLWGRIKKKTDLDVVAYRGGHILIIECKSEVRRSQRGETQLNTISKHYEELMYKSQWVAQNFDEFVNITKDTNLSKTAVTAVIPFFVTAFIEPYKEARIISLKELEEVVRFLPPGEIKTNLKIPLAGAIEITCPVFEIRRDRSIRP